MSPNLTWRVEQKVNGVSEESIFGKVDRAREQGNEEKMTAFHLLGFLGWPCYFSFNKRLGN
jgi:hypothetical protein